MPVRISSKENTKPFKNTQTYYVETAADARRRMLAEMGSLRNARSAVYNTKDKALLVRLGFQRTIIALYY